MENLKGLFTKVISKDYIVDKTYYYNKRGGDMFTVQKSMPTIYKIKLVSPIFIKDNIQLIE